MYYSGSYLESLLSSNIQEPADWIISQKWSHVAFMHYEVDVDHLGSLLPIQFMPDTINGKAYVSIVPFHMSGIRFPFTTTLPFSALWELNLRTYITYKGQPGIYFFTLDSTHRLGNFIARKFFALPYRYQKMYAKISGNKYILQAENSLRLSFEIGNEIKKNDLVNWLVERYHLFTIKNNQVLRGTVIHKPWKLNSVINLKIRNNFSQEFNFVLPKQPDHCSYSKLLDVSFKPFVKV